MMKPRRRFSERGLRSSFLAALVLSLLLIVAGAAAENGNVPQRHFDLLIRGGQVIDGSGAARYRADVGVIGDRIAAIGELSSASATRVISATGFVVTPGFVDLHAHLADVEGGEAGLLSRDPRRRKS